MADTNLSFSITLPFKQRCMLPDCGIATKRVYKVNQGGYNLSFHSNDHARIGIARWEEKKRLGITPGNPRPKIDEEEFTGDNLQELGEKE